MSRRHQYQYLGWSRDGILILSKSTYDGLFNYHYKHSDIFLYCV